MKKIIYWLLTPFRYVKNKRQLNKKLAELRKKDPFIYK